MCRVLPGTAGRGPTRDPLDPSVYFRTRGTIAQLSIAHPQGDCLEARRQLAVARSWAPLLIISVLIAGVAGYVISNSQPRIYEGRALLIVGQSLSGANPDYNQLLVSQRLSATYATVATTRPILERVIARVGLQQTTDELARNVQAVAAPDNALLSILARDGDPARAAAISNALAEELIAVSPAVAGEEAELLKAVDEDLAAVREQITATQSEIALLVDKAERTPAEDARLETLRDRVTTLRSTYSNLLSFRSSDSSNLLTTVEAAVAPLVQVSPRPLFTAILAAVLGLLVGSAIAFVLEYLDDTVKSPADVEELLGLPTLGAISMMPGGKNRPAMYRLAALLYPQSPVAEAYRTVRTNIEFASLDRPLGTLLVTSGAPHEGKTVTAANLAVLFAQAGRSVLLVDTDLRRPTLDTLFRVKNEGGLTTLLRSDEATLESVAHETEQPNLRLLTTGPLPPNPADLLGSKRMKALVARLRKEADLVIFDSPPLRIVTDAAVLSSLVDATVLVVRAGQSRGAEVRHGREMLKPNVAVLGVVLNGIKAPQQPVYDQYAAASMSASDKESSPTG